MCFSDGEVQFTFSSINIEHNGSVDPYSAPPSLWAKNPSTMCHFTPAVYLVWSVLSCLVSLIYNDPDDVFLVPCPIAGGFSDLPPMVF